MAGGDVYTSFLDKSRVNRGHDCKPQIVGGSDFALGLPPAKPKHVTAGENPGNPCMPADREKLLPNSSQSPLAAQINSRAR